MQSAAESIVTFDISAKLLRNAWRSRLVLSSILILIGGASAAAGDVYGWGIVAVGSVLGMSAIAKLRGLRNAPRIEFLHDRLQIWGMLGGTPRTIPYVDVRMADWQVVRRAGLARIAQANRFPFSIDSARLGSVEAFQDLVGELERRLPTGRVVSHRARHSNRPYATFAVIACLVAVHTGFVISGAEIGTESILRSGALVTVLVSQGELFRLITDAALHANWLHLILNANIIAIGFGELESRIGTPRTAILMIVGAVGASCSAWMFSIYPIVIGASGMAYASLGGIAYQLVVKPSTAPLSFQIAPAWWLLVLAMIDVLYGVFDEQVSFAMHAGGFVSGAVTMAALSGTLGTASRTTKWIVNGLAGIGVALVGSSAFALYRYNAADHPEHLMQVRLLNPQLPAEVINAAAYRLVRNPGATRQELKAATIGIERVLSSPATAQLAGDLLAAYSDTAAMLAVRTGDLAAGRALELRAVALATRTRSARQPKAGMYLARVAQFELAAPAPAREATVTITARAHELCVSAARPAAAGQSLRAVAMRNDAPIGLLLVPDSRRGVATCVPAAVAAGDRVRVTYVGAARAAGAPRFFAVRARDADLPAFVLGP